MPVKIFFNLGFFPQNRESSQGLAVAAWYKGPADSVLSIKMVLSSCLLVLIVCITSFTTQRHVNSVYNINVKLMVYFPKRVIKIFVLLNYLQME